ncbi:dinucleotide-utilizing protein [Antarcticibacterium flavum]|uniref:Molybdopterin-synthase adenylyltransferase n=1 Tax=Antarcticibacterium flavum TaxID=2058175 RepID=A0A5B7X454_9FLAO|nr:MULTISPECIES: HesA/MoeB/ThiF family protein [Antarcticibacterium]MCM4158294.1 dinucleotide-utilizing protein [Antarcticibacterium sp. W02-3]QCY70060.1 dinucleotide-utilizing protein [Antarcticibacterium flavum]
MSRFERQHILPEFGTSGQKKLKKARILVVGAGGLGCPALLYLAAAGVGTIGIADGDTVSLSNLNRQTLFGYGDLEKLKAIAAGEVLNQKYPDINIETINEYLTPDNILEIMEKYDLVLDGSDNFGTRYMVNDACVLRGKPLIMGAIYQYEGQVTVFNYGEEPVNYRDLYPVPPSADEIPNCSETGVLGVLPGIIGTLMAAEAIKVISGLGKVLANKVLFYDLLNSGFYEVSLKPNLSSGKNIPENEVAFRNTDYNITCGVVEKITWENALHWTCQAENSIVIDIREPNEEPEFSSHTILKIPMNDLLKDPGILEEVDTVMLFCKSGQRSMQAAKELRQRFPEKEIRSVEGGLQHPSSPLNNQNNES